MTSFVHRMNRGRRLAKDVCFCERCEMALFLVGASEGDATVCQECFDKLAVDQLMNDLPCSTCGRRHEYQFHCNWCFAAVCEGCVHGDHEKEYLITCFDPDWEEGGYG